MVALNGASRFKPVPGFCNTDATADGQDSANLNPSTPDSEDRPVWTGESGAVSALDAIQMARAAGAKLANTGIK